MLKNTQFLIYAFRDILGLWHQNLKVLVPIPENYQGMTIVGDRKEISSFVAIEILQKQNLKRHFFFNTLYPVIS